MDLYRVEIGEVWRELIGGRVDENWEGNFKSGVERDWDGRLGGDRLECSPGLVVGDLVGSLLRRDFLRFRPRRMLFRLFSLFDLLQKPGWNVLLLTLPECQSQSSSGKLENHD